MSASAAEMIYEAGDAAVAIAKRRRRRAPPLIDGDKVRRLLGTPAGLENGRARDRDSHLRRCGRGGYAREPIAIAMLLRGAGLPRLDA